MQLPKLTDAKIYPVLALKELIKTYDESELVIPLFQIRCISGFVYRTVFKARSTLRTMVLELGLNPLEYTFHSFCCSGVSLAFNSNIALDSVKQHGNWQSDAVCTYLGNTPTAASVILTTLQQLIA